LTCGNTDISDSCLLENTATYLFCISSSSYTVNLIHCTVDKCNYCGGSLKTSKATMSFILPLVHLSTENCFASFDAVGDLTAVLPERTTPMPTKNMPSTGRCLFNDQFHGKSLY
jgi:hypothetical protein